MSYAKAARHLLRFTLAVALETQRSRFKSPTSYRLCQQYLTRQTLPAFLAQHRTVNAERLFDYAQPVVESFIAAAESGTRSE